MYILNSEMKQLQWVAVQILWFFRLVSALAAALEKDTPSRLESNPLSTPTAQLLLKNNATPPLLLKYCMF